MNIKVLNLMSRNNETLHVTLQETCACKCKLDASVCNDKQRWNSDKCRCECKKLIDKSRCVIDKSRCNDGFVCNPSICVCYWDNSCNPGEYLDDANCKCRKRLFEKYDEDIDENEMVYNVT